MKALLTVLLVSAPVPALAAPVNLACTIRADGRDQIMDLALNEASGTAGYTWRRSGHSTEYRAAFTPTTVIFGPFTINRATLAITRRSDTSSAAPTDEGACEIVKVDRAF